MLLSKPSVSGERLTGFYWAMTSLCSNSQDSQRTVCWKGLAVFPNFPKQLVWILSPPQSCLRQLLHNDSTSARRTQRSVRHWHDRRGVGTVPSWGWLLAHPWLWWEVMLRAWCLSHQGAEFSPNAHPKWGNPQPCCPLLFSYGELTSNHLWRGRRCGSRAGRSPPACPWQEAQGSWLGHLQL